MSSAHLRPITENDLDMVLSWRNHEEIRKFMTNQDIIDFSEHLAWFERNRLRQDRFFLIFEFENCPEGYISFVPIANSKVYEWGFYIRPNAPKGLGKILGKTALDFAFNQQKFHKIFGQVLGFNTRSIKFHESLGFINEGVLRKHFYDERGETDIYQFGLLQTEWYDLQ